LQRSRRIHRRSGRERSRASRRRLRAVGLVGQVDERQHEREPHHVATAHRSRARRDVLRQSRRGAHLSYLLPLIFVALVYATMITLNERIGLFRDHFPNTAMKIGAYVLLGAFLVLVTLMIVASALAPPSAKDLARIPFYSLFALHAILIIFLGGWWL